MSDFADVEGFAREHAACGGLTPSAMPRPGGGGYILTLTCTCGTSFDRSVSPEEARLPLPIPARAPQPEPRAAATELEAPAVPASTPAPSVACAGPLALGPRRPPAWAGVPGRREPEEPPPAPLGLPGNAGASRWPRPGGRPRPAPERLSPDTRAGADLQEPVELAEPPGLPRPSRRRAVWLALLALAALGAAVVYLSGGADGLLPPVSSAPPPRTGHLQRAPLEHLVRSLRELQAVAASATSVSVYSTRVTAAEGEAERYLAAGAPGATRTRVREALDLHLLAVSAWRAKSLDRQEAWEAVGLDPSIDLCPPLRLVADFAPPDEKLSRAQTRGAAVASALQIVWECARQRLATLEQTLADR